ncbi:bifunctional 4-hydroxy-2-oxoglutarate aldolase/2-dehydro-3-deoxy-phosphogluconate aldolase [Anaerorhabdus sp.]|uniref:bifunctional 4-hydroxy-2-oxoglutarate aldolase/2-dehydro-3-deoxy-phosphogluconate aldolase n=1 Tax=Anaerorhabdus sp. TaxID=1872524 RepID=UPI002FC90554
MINTELRKQGIVPVVTIQNVEDAVPLAAAIIEGGLNIIEVTFRSDVAYEAINEIHKAYPQMIILAGTILTIEQVDQAIEAGAQVLVSPGLNRKIVEYCLSKEIQIIPGCSSPSDLEQALECGLKIVKFFPAEANGGINAIKAMSAPYGGLQFMPTGGINEQNLMDYLSFDKVIACGGSFMCTSQMIQNKDWMKITEQTKNAIKKVLNFEFAHLGVNLIDKDLISSINQFKSLLSTEIIRETSKSTFVDFIEIMHDSNFGKCGHIGIATSDIDRAIYYLSKQNFSFDLESITYDEKKNKKFIYINEEMNGFKIHLIKK